MIVPPRAAHRQTFILLHGQGSSAAKFGPGLLETHFPVTNSVDLQARTQTLALAFPHAKFAFPTAPRRRAAIYKRSVINQWFDCWHADEPGVNDWMMIDGLRETVSFLHELLRDEIALVGSGRNVVLGGISQGCAAAFVSMLLWDGEPLAAVLGICGYFPFQQEIKEAIEPDDPDPELDSFDPFERSDDEADRSDPAPDARLLEPAQRAALFLRERLELGDGQSASELAATLRETPFWAGHGTNDEKVAIHLGREAAACLGSMDVDVSWNEYEGLGHWYSEAMLAEFVSFLRDRTDWEQS